MKRENQTENTLFGTDAPGFGLFLPMVAMGTTPGASASVIFDGKFHCTARHLTFDGLMAKKRQSAGLVLYSISTGTLRILLVHPGGPIFANRDEGAWGIPKGEFRDNESPFEAACREFEEETGFKPEAREFLKLGSIVQKGGKQVMAWAFEGEWAEDRLLRSNECDLEWPPKSGKKIRIPEIDAALMATVEVARTKMRPDQFPLVERLIQLLAEREPLPSSTH